MKLYIDTSSSENTVVRLGTAELVRSSAVLHSQVVLPMVEELLGSQKVALDAITEIEVKEGPGSFTGLRVGVTIANTLGFVLKVPVNGKEVWKLDIVEPIYEWMGKSA